MGAATSLLAIGHSNGIKTVFSDSSFANFGELATERLPVEKGLPSFFMPGIFTAGRILMDFKIDEVRLEVVLRELHNKQIFLMHGKAHSVIPVSHFYRLKEAGGANIVGAWVVPGADHTQGYDLYPQKYL